LDYELQLCAHRSQPDIHQFVSSHHLERLFPHYTTCILV
jgi:septal ring-binding cell division protein DamX